MRGSLRLAPLAVVAGGLAAVQLVEVRERAAVPPMEPAPQILGVMASAEPIPMTCVGNVCRVDLTTFCLQSRRPVADLGTPYRVASGGLTLLAEDDDGTPRELAPTNPIAVISSRTYTTVTVEADFGPSPGGLPRRVLISVAGDTTLVPLPRPGTMPQDPDEIARVIEHERPRATRFFDVAGGEPAAADIVNRLVNSVFPDGHPREGLWQSVVGGRSDAWGENGRSRARGILETCRRETADDPSQALRGCLLRQHDALVSALNTRFWTAVGGPAGG